MSDLDTQLLTRENLSKKEQERAGRLIRRDKQIKKQEQRDSGNKRQEQNENKKREMGKFKTARQQLTDVRRQGVKGKIKQETKDYAKKKAAVPARMYTNSLLRWSWIVLIPSWGLSLIYINIHAFMRLIMPSLFCSLGDEWVPVPIKAASGYRGSRIVRIIEKMVFALVEVIALIIVSIALVFIAIIVYAATEPIKAIWDMGGPLLKVFAEMLRM
jgi:hypothetical protein